MKVYIAEVKTVRRVDATWYNLRDNTKYGFMALLKFTELISWRNISDIVPFIGR